MTASLKSFSETQRYDTELLGDIQAHVIKKAAQDKDRRQDIIHPSELCKADVCPRSIAWRIRGVEPSDPSPVNGVALETIFQEGHDIHSKWQTWLWEMGRLWGSWRCLSCGEVWPGLSPESCICGSRNIRYNEVPLEPKGLMIAGHADGAVPDIKSFIEIKSVGLGTLRIEEPDLVRQFTHKVDGKSVVDYDGLWKALKRPLLSHRKQGGLYLALARALGWDYDRMVYIYENKANQQVKEFSIKYSESLIDPLLDIAADIKWAVQNQRDLPRPDGFTKTRKPCTSCVFRTLCWGEEDDDRTPLEDAADGTSVAGSEAATGPAEDLRTRPTRRRPARAARRPDRPAGPGPDEPDGEVHPVGGLPGRTTRRRGGGRTFGRRAGHEDRGAEVVGEQ